MSFIFEFFAELFGTLIYEGIQFLGASVLYTAGVVVKFFVPNTKTYSFKAIRNMEYDKKDPYMMRVEEIGQRIVGFAFLGVIIAIIIYLI